MKLLHCLKCKDVKAIVQEVRECECGKSAAVYIDNRKVMFSGPSVILGIENSDLEKLEEKEPPIKFAWYLIKEPKSTVIRAKRVEDRALLTRKSESARLAGPGRKRS